MSNDSKTSSVVTIFGPKGGVGTTTLAVNVAYALMRQAKGKVLIVDFDLHDCGDVALLCGGQNLPSIYDFSPKLHKMSESEIEKNIYKTKDGLAILPAIRKFKHASALTYDMVSTMIEMMRKQYQYIVVDCGSTIYPSMVKMLEISSLTLFCTTAEIVTLNRSVQSLTEFQELAFPADMIQLVINQFDPKGIISEEMITQKLKRKCLGFLPNEPKEMQAAVNQGAPLFATNSRAIYSRVTEDLVRKMIGKNLLQPVKSLALKTANIVGVTGISTENSVATPMARNITNKEVERVDSIKQKVHARLIDVMDFKKMSPEELMKQDDESMEALKNKTQEAILGIVSKMNEITSREERQQIVKDVLDEAIGLGPLEDLLRNPNISEIMVNRADQIFVEQNGKPALINARFSGDKQLMGVIERIVAPIGRRIDEKTPMVDARLRDGSRVHAIIPPLALDGPVVTIRKFSKEIMGPETLIKFGALTEEMSDFLRACVQAKLNIIISGGTGTGKTTLLNTMASFIPNNDRIITVEDSAELRLAQEHLVRLESRPANLQGEGAIPIRELVRNTLRMRPDRIVVGECRGAEALDMLQAMNTGHDGSMTTLHANTPTRLQLLV
jgi:pilus assembly protein CpaF